MRQASESIGDASRRYLSVCLAWTVALCFGCGSRDTPGPDDTAGPNSVVSTSPVKQSATSPVAQEADPLYPVVQIETSFGPIVAQLNAEKAPGTVRNFLDYVNEGFYANTLVHYADPDNMILGGGYTPSGELKPTRLSIRNEAHNGLKNERGTLAMARDANVVDSATTQFFINLADMPALDFVDDATENYGYCVFGEVTDGLDIVERIARTPTNDQGGDLFQTPVQPIVITSIRILR